MCGVTHVDGCGDCSNRGKGRLLIAVMCGVPGLLTTAPPSPTPLSFQGPPHQPADGDPPAAVERIDRADSVHVRIMHGIEQLLPPSSAALET